MTLNLLPTLVILLVATLLSWWLERDFLPLRRGQKRALQALLLLAALGSLGTYVCQAVAWEPEADSWLGRAADTRCRRPGPVVGSEDGLGLLMRRCW